MSQNKQQVALPVNSHEQNKISLNRDSFLKTVKKLHKHLQAESKSDFKLSDIQEALAKSLGNRNWRELDEKFQSNITKPVATQETTLKFEKPLQNNKNLMKLLNVLNASQISKLLSFNVYSDNWGENAKKLTHSLSIIISQNNNCSKMDIAQIYDLFRLEKIYEIYEAINNNHKETKIVLMDKNEDEDEYIIELTSDLRSSVINYIHMLPMYEQTKRENSSTLSFNSVTIENHGYLMMQIRHSLSTLMKLDEDFIIFKHKWIENEHSEFKKQFENEYNGTSRIGMMDYEWQDSSWLFHLTSIFRLVERRRKISNWIYHYENIHTVSVSDLFYLYATNVIEEKSVNIKNTIQNILDNLQTYRELSYEASKKYD